MKKFDSVKKDIAKVLKRVDKMRIAKSKSDSTEASEKLQKEKAAIIENITAIERKIAELQTYFKTEIQNRTSKYKRKIEVLQRAKESTASDNYLLEYKKKDLLKLAADLEEANESISKNALALEEARNEMERQKEALLDQADYLHESNETIIQMHEEVQKQKEEILHKNDELLSLNNEKNNLIGIVAHDLKSPLNQIKGLASLLKLTVTGSEETLQYIAMIEQSASRLSNMIAKILDVEAIESKQINLSLEKTNLSELVETIYVRFKLDAEQKEIVLHKNIDQNIFCHVDKGYTDQVIQNLLSNAIKFSPANKNIYLTLTGTPEKVVCEIKDEGPGLTDEDKKKLFGKYQKLSAKPTGNEISTGLGLSIVKRFVEAMDGKIWCESVEGKGASFFVSFTRL